jgi:hypothetical protein
MRRRACRQHASLHASAHALLLERRPDGDALAVEELAARLLLILMRGRTSKAGSIAR